LRDAAAEAREDAETFNEGNSTFEDALSELGTPASSRHGSPRGASSRGATPRGGSLFSPGAGERAPEAGSDEWKDLELARLR
jgi:hypothetical protein